jgi:hypothetical protein
MPYALAVGAGGSPQLWRNTRTPRSDGGVDQSLPLFTCYYGLAWHPLRGLVDLDGSDLWDKAVERCMADRAWGMERHSPWWGVSAGDGPRGYAAYSPANSDGTVHPTAALAAMSVLPADVERDVMAWRQEPNWDKVNGPCGLAPFNAAEDWYAGDYVGIDLGSFFLAYANRHSGLVSRLWARHPRARAALAALFRRRTEEEVAPRRGNRVRRPGPVARATG